MRLTAPILFPLLLLATAAHAEVYKCVVAGKTSYTDRPCAAGAEPAALPPLMAVPSRPSADLAAGHDARINRDKASRDKADAAFVKSHAEKTAREKAVRAAIIDHQVVKGMTASEVDSALGSADETLPNGTRRYRRDGQRTTVTFKDGVVSSVGTTTEGRKK